MQMQHHHHHHHRPNTTHLVPLSNYDVTELKLENGQLAMHGLGGLLPTAPEKPIWGIKAGDTLESIVHQATCHKREQNSTHHDRTPANTSSMVASSGGGGGRTWTGDSGQPVPVPVPQGWTKKRPRPQASDSYGKFFCSSTTSNIHEEHADPSACTASARFCRDNTTMNTWASFESPPSLKTKSTDEDSASHGGLENQEEERREITTKGDESGLSHSTRPRRVAAIHNQSERKRRDRINQKMKALQRLVPNASKTDKASMLDEVIKYLEQLKAQVQMLSSVRNMPHMMMPLGMQQHLHQMSVLQAHMSMGTRTVGPVGLGMGMGMLDMDTVARMASHQQLLPPLPLIHHPAVAAAAPTFMNPPFMVPPHPTSAQAKPDPASANTTNASGYPLPDPYNALLTQQTMNMELFNRMAELYRQQVNQTTGATSSPSSQSNHVQGD